MPASLVFSLSLSLCAAPFVNMYLGVECLRISMHRGVKTERGRPVASMRLHNAMLILNTRDSLRNCEMRTGKLDSTMPGSSLWSSFRSLPDPHAPTGNMYDNARRAVSFNQIDTKFCSWGTVVMISRVSITRKWEEYKHVEHWKIYIHVRIFARKFEASFWTKLSYNFLRRKNIYITILYNCYKKRRIFKQIKYSFTRGGRYFFWSLNVL